MLQRFPDPATLAAISGGVKRLMNQFNDAAGVQVPSFPSARKSGEEGKSRPQLKTQKTRRLRVSAVK
jgi:hypothetical protein